MQAIPSALVDRILKQRPDIRDFVETGTYIGETVDAVVNKFDRVWTIELSEKLHRDAQEKYKSDLRVRVLHGDSRAVLPSVLDKLGDRPALFWLDGHFSGGVTAKLADTQTAIRGEIEAIRQHRRKDHVILVDDAVDFNGQNGYPATFELLELLQKISPWHTIKFHRLRRGIIEAARFELNEFD